MTAYRQVYDSRHLQADCQEPGSAPEPYARQSSMGYLYLYVNTYDFNPQADRTVGEFADHANTPTTCCGEIFSVQNVEMSRVTMVMPTWGTVIRRYVERRQCCQLTTTE